MIRESMSLPTMKPPKLRLGRRPISKFLSAWPGLKMTPAPEVGENVFKITDVPKEATAVIFNSFVDAGYPAEILIQRSNVTVCDTAIHTQNITGMAWHNALFTARYGFNIAFENIIGNNVANLPSGTTTVTEYLFDVYSCYQVLFDRLHFSKEWGAAATHWCTDVTYRNCTVPADSTSSAPLTFRHHSIRCHFEDMHVLAEFTDVPSTHWAYEYVR